MTRAEQRLIQERIMWRSGHPHDLHARPQVFNGRVDLFTWECAILGRKGTYLDGRVHRLLLRFPRAYPLTQPSGMFVSSISKRSSF
ncbi:SUMO-conjugating enzyme UBC9 [Gracilariopsis chorda]|uniref:SUMO-conjugating enzyme UBC9 n=1 Tax=Gracilariopsis chorda TaxID=448386 RepID=A0A2V3IGH0_9FLOR|nr:SUMO-conjugating enzyme UBC9 [Gracilariopsis chorda]PXF41169.1 SUMO-conjugating enzyme UBC9 [Gracilariopsis chorda]|eukprot:PXF40669.1 SUMO-conjugating enzyme UBC9 [Gracilariopsis chorda]